MTVPEGLSSYNTPLIVTSYGGTPSETVNVSELEAPSHASPLLERVAAVGVEPIVTVTGVPRLTGLHDCASVTPVRVKTVVALSKGVVIGVPLT